MPKKLFLDKQQNQQAFIGYGRPILNKELLIAIYFLFFIFGITTRSDYTFYNEYRVIQITLLLTLGLSTLSYRRLSISKVELFF